MQINVKDPNLLTALNARLTREIGETFVANCALDLMGDAMVSEREALIRHNGELIQRTTADRELIASLRAEIVRLAPRKKA